MKGKAITGGEAVRKLKVKNKKVLIVGAVIAVVCVGAGALIFLKRDNGGSEDTAAVQEAVVEKGTISNTIVGTGNLELKASETVQIPSGITVKEVKVESGDAVAKGDVLATVDKTSVLEVLSTVQESIEDIDDQINDCKNGDDTETVTAAISGTIQKIYAKKGDSVTERIAEDGSLLVISASDTGDKIEVIAGSGTISKIHVSKGQSVSSGTKLFTIINDESSEKYAVLISQRKELAETAQKLAQMVQTGKITADEDGTVVDVNVTGSTNSTETSGSSGSSMSNMSSTIKGGSDKESSTYKIMTLSSSGTAEAADSSDETASDSDGTSADGSAAETEETLSLTVAGSGSSSASRLVIAAPVTGEKPQTSISVSNGSYNGSITWNPSADTFAAETTYRAGITLKAADGYVFSSGSITKAETGTLSGISVSGDGKTLTFSITFPATAADISTEDTSSGNTSGNSDTNDSSSSDNEGGTDMSDSSGSTGSIGSDSSGNGNSSDSASGASGSKGSSGNGGGTSSSVNSSSGGSTGSASSGSTSVSDSSSDSGTSSVSVSEVTAFTLATDDTMMLSVNVDELDINSVEEDQEAEVTLDAIEDAAFTGTVTKVSASASVASGSAAKYVVEISIQKDEQIKAGMNASATIVVEKKEDVLTIPVNALQERGSEVFVYTEQDSEGNLSGEVEVTTGLSDGSTVEITDGLSEGDTVYYQKSGNISGDDFGQMDGGMDGGFNGDDSGMSGKGGMPDGGGDMPSGERRGDD